MRKRLALTLFYLLVIAVAASSCGKAATEAPVQTETQTKSPETVPPTTQKPEPKPASFTVSSLVVSPSEVTSGSAATVSVLVTNNGDLAGSYDVNLQIDGAVEATEKVTLNGGESQKVSFTMKKSQARTYAISVEKLTASLVVKELPTTTTTTTTPLEPKPLALTSTAFQNNTAMPVKYTQDGQNVSPPLAWTQPPSGTRSFAIVMDDPDADSKPDGISRVHWVIFNIPDTVRELPEAVPTESQLGDGTLQGTNDAGRIGYRGPGPSPGDPPHRYQFTLFALDQMLSLSAGATRAQLMAAMQGHILGQIQMVGLYGR